MSVGFARPRVSDLVFHLYGRSVHPELFTIFAERIFLRDDVQAVIRICDAGHVVEVRHRGRTITEIATSRRHPLPKRKRLLEKRLCGCRDEAVTFQTGLHYQVSHQLERLDQEVFLNFHEELAMDCAQANLAHCFPAGNRLSPDALSVIRAEFLSGGLVVHTYHTFPEDCAVVKTQSLFEF